MTNILFSILFVNILLRGNQGTPLEEFKLFMQTLKKYKFDEAFQEICPKTSRDSKVCFDDFPSSFDFKSLKDGIHGMKYLAKGAFGKVYVNQNNIVKVSVCDEYETRQALQETKLGLLIQRIGNPYLTPTTECCSDNTSLNSIG